MLQGGLGGCTLEAKGIYKNQTTRKFILLCEIFKINV